MCASSVRSTAVFALLLRALLHAETAGASSYERAVLQLQRGDTAGVIQGMEALLRVQPSDLRALTLLGMALTAAGRVKDANHRYEQALRIDSRYAPALRALAINEMAVGSVESAQEHFRALLNLTPDEPIAHVALGEILYKERRYADSVQHFERSGKALLADTSNVLKFADAAIQSSQPAKAEAALRSFPSNAEAEQHLQAGLMLARLGRFETAAREFELAAAGHDKYLAAYNLALARLKAGRYDAAIATVDKVVAGGVRTAELYNVQAHAYEKSGRTREAYEALRTATRIDPGDELNYLDLIAICLEHKNLDLALQISDIGLRVLPKSDRLQLQKGVVWAMKGDYDQARSAFSAASGIAPGKGLPQVALGLVLLQLDQPAEAAKVLRSGAATKDDQYLFRWFLAEALSRSGAEAGSADEQEAVNGLRECIEQRPDLAQPRVLLGKFLSRRGELDAAVAQLERALEIDPENSTAMYQLAQAYRRKGDKRAAQLFAKISSQKAEERDELTRKGLKLITESAR